MRLVRDGTLFNSLHRGGWPFVMHHLQRIADGHGLLLDDFAEATYSYAPMETPIEGPWVGIFHHPCQIDSPWPDDQRFHIGRLCEHDSFLRAAQWLRGCIALSPDVAAYLGRFFRDRFDREMPILTLHHPTELNVPRWQGGDRLVWQTGFFLRNLRLVFCLDGLLACERPWRLSRSKPYAPWHVLRDAALQQRVERSVADEDVEEVPRLNHGEYDARMARCVVVMQSYGGSANNVTLECIARHAPLVINRSPAAEYYLGRDYPLYFGDSHKIAGLLQDDARIQQAQQHLARMSKAPFEAEQFAVRVRDFCMQVE